MTELNWVLSNPDIYGIVNIVKYFDQLLLAGRKVHVVYLDQLLGAAHYINFI